MAHYAFTFQDRSREKSVVTVPFHQPDGITFNYVEDMEAGQAALIAALNGVSLANMLRASATSGQEAPNTDVPTSPYANREAGLRIFMVGADTGARVNITVPAPDLANLTFVGQTDEILLADGGIMAALVAALEEHYYINSADWQSFEGITVESAWVVGRNN